MHRDKERSSMAEGVPVETKLLPTNVTLSCSHSLWGCSECVTHSHIAAA